MAKEADHDELLQDLAVALQGCRRRSEKSRFYGPEFAEKNLEVHEALRAMVMLVDEKRNEVAACKPKAP